jgi:hypothetical protein
MQSALQVSKVRYRQAKCATGKRSTRSVEGQHGQVHGLSVVKTCLDKINVTIDLGNSTIDLGILSRVLRLTSTDVVSGVHTTVL